VLKLIHLTERTELVSGETSVTVCIAVRGIQREKMIERQREREECDRQRGETSKARRILGKAHEQR
jgi:hypothetical protein